MKNMLYPMNFIAVPYGMLLLPKKVKLYTEGRVQEISEIIKRYTFFIGLSGALYGVVFVGSSDYIFPVLNIDLNNENIEMKSIILITVSTLLQASLLWWNRNFSSLENPLFSVYNGLFMVAYMLSVTVFMTWAWGLFGLILSILVMRVIIGVGWYRLMQTRFSRKIER